MTFNISWQAEEDVTLTLARIIGSLDTQVLSVNSTDAEFFNNWANKGTVDVINGTENIFLMTLTLDNIVLEDEGQYKILVEAESSSNTHYFALQTYGKSLQMSYCNINLENMIGKHYAKPQYVPTTAHIREG
ncbi:MAG: hypothetical protein AB2693_01090 [Candidatus Thiodiazotropha sp.]